jgi:hypothetical protein
MVLVLDLLPHEIMEREGWVRGDLQTSPEDYVVYGLPVGVCGRCALGALVPVDDTRALWEQDTGVAADRHEFHYALALLAFGEEKLAALVDRALEWLEDAHFDFTARFRTPAPAIIYLWNDHPDQTADNVIQTFKDVGL